MKNALKLKERSFIRKLLEGEVEFNKGLAGRFVVGDRYPGSSWKADCVRFVKPDGNSEVSFGVCLRGNSKQRRQQRRLVERFLNEGRQHGTAR